MVWSALPPTALTFSPENNRLAAKDSPVCVISNPLSAVDGVDVGGRVAAWAQVADAGEGDEHAAHLGAVQRPDARLALSAQRGAHSARAAAGFVRERTFVWEWPILWTLLDFKPPARDKMAGTSGSSVTICFREQATNTRHILFCASAIVLFLFHIDSKEKSCTRS